MQKLLYNAQTRPEVVITLKDKHFIYARNISELGFLKISILEIQFVRNVVSLDIIFHKLKHSLTFVHM